MKVPAWIPHLREVKDLEEDEPTKTEPGVVKYEYRDEANRPWWKFFSEYEYRMTTEEKKNLRWWKWYADTDSKAERVLLLKLDICLTFYSFVVYWVKYLDQTNLNNAYVTNMQEDLNFQGNDLVQTQAMFTVGAVIFQIPFMYLFVYAPSNIFLPLMDICWGLFTLGIYRVETVSQLKALRFFVGVFESAFYPAVHYLLGSWYKPNEYGRRGGVYYFGQMLGVLTSGLLQSATFDGLNGVNGLAGWRWMFIVSAIITFPVGIIGFWALPGTPDRCYSVFLTDDEIRLARKRVGTNKVQTPKFFDKALWIRILTSWKVYLITFCNILLWNNNNGTSGAYLLWLKSLKRYAPGKLNQMSAISPALGILWIFLTNTSADLLLSRWFAIVWSQVFNFIGNTILAVWFVPESAKWVGFMLQYFGWAMASTFYGWMADISRHDKQERAIILVVSNMIAQAFSAWISVLVFKTVEAPRYLKGYTFTAVCAFLLIVFAFVLLALYKSEERKNARQNGIVLYDSSKGQVPDEVHNSEAADIDSPVIVRSASPKPQHSI